MKPELWISLFSILLAIGSLAFTIVAWLKQKSLNASITFLSGIAQVERTLAETPTALKFHGIDPDDLRKIGITPEEFSYLVASFTVGWIYHDGVTPNDRTPWEPGHYRYAMCSSPALREAWPFLKKMIGPCAYCDKIDATIQSAERATSQNARPTTSPS